MLSIGKDNQETYPMGSSYLGLNDWHGHGEKPNTKALDRSSHNKARKVRGESLDKSHGEVDEATYPDTPFPPHNIAEGTRKERSKGGGELKA
jgi:hypothetical protein